MATTTLTYERAIELAPQQEFFSGPPPEIGWWMTQYVSSVYRMRWWDGKHWSVYVNQQDADAGRTEAEAAIKTNHRPSQIKYCARFWEGK